MSHVFRVESAGEGCRGTRAGKPLNTKNTREAHVFHVLEVVRVQERGGSSTARRTCPCVLCVGLQGDKGRGRRATQSHFSCSASGGAVVGGQ